MLSPTITIRVALLDSYPTPTYISSHVLPHHTSPIRYLSTSAKVPESSPVGHPLCAPSSACQPPCLQIIAAFSPPNLLLSTSAAFVSILALVENAQALLLLLPSPHVPPPAPNSLGQSDVKSLTTVSDDTTWELSVVRAAHQVLLQAIGSESGNVWNDRADGKLFTEKKRGRIGDIGEGSMYI